MHTHEHITMISTIHRNITHRNNNIQTNITNNIANDISTSINKHKQTNPNTTQISKKQIKQYKPYQTQTTIIYIILFI